MIAASRRSGLTLVEVLVAAALLMVFGASITSAFSVAARLHRAAAIVAQRSGAFEPFIVAADASLAAVPECPMVLGDATAGDDEPPGVCWIEVSTCRVDGAELRCGGGDLRRVRLGWTRSAGVASGPSTTIDVWSRRTP